MSHGASRRKVCGAGSTSLQPSIGTYGGSDAPTRRLNYEVEVSALGKNTSPLLYLDRIKQTESDYCQPERKAFSQSFIMSAEDPPGSAVCKAVDEEEAVVREATPVRAVQTDPIDCCCLCATPTGINSSRRE